MDLLTVVCRFSMLCWPVGEPATRLSRASRQMEVKVVILLVKEMVKGWSLLSLLHLYLLGGS